MSLYVGSVENWNLFFSQLGYKPNQQATDLTLLIKSAQQQQHNVADILDYFKSDFVNVIKTYEIERIGEFTKNSELCSYSEDRRDYDSMVDCMNENMHDHDDYNDLKNRTFYIDKYIRFYSYKGIEKEFFGDIRIMKNVADAWSPSYLPLMSSTFIISNIDNATHKIYFIPYSDITEVWLYESSADFYRFRCFAEMIVTNTIAGYLGYDYLEYVTISDLKKYNADLILNLDLLQQSDLPME